MWTNSTSKRTNFLKMQSSKAVWRSICNRTKTFSKGTWSGWNSKFRMSEYWCMYTFHPRSIIIEWSLVGLLPTAVALEFVANVHPHVGHRHVLLLLLHLHVCPSAREGEEDGWGYWGQVFVVKGDKGQHSLVLPEDFMRLVGVELKDVVEDEAAKLGLLLAWPKAMAEHCKEPVHKLEAIQANGLYTFWLVS